MSKPLLLATATACSSNDPPPPVASADIGTAGGSLSVTTGSLTGTTISIPAGALTQTTTVQIHDAAVVVVSGFRAIGPAASFMPDGMAITAAATITLPFDASQLTTGAPTSDIVVKTRASSGLLSDITPTTIDTANGLITFTHTDFARHWIAVVDTADHSTTSRSGVATTTCTTTTAC